MSTVTLTLKNPRYAPWGLLTDEETPQMIVWLTEEDPVKKIEATLLTDWDVVRIKQSEAADIIVAEGLESVKLVTEEAKVRSAGAPISTPVQSKVSSSNTIMDVTQLMRQDADRAKALEERVKSRYPKLDELLAMPAHKLKKELKELAKDGTMVSFFQEARKKEQDGKDRKTVLSVLTDIIQSKINAVGLDGRASTQTGQTALSEAYYDMIEEFEDEEEEEETVQTDSTS